MTGRPRKYAAKKKPVIDSTVPTGPKEARLLTCTRCELRVTLSLAPQDERPLHRCQVVYKAMPFDKDQRAADVPRTSIAQWFEEAPKHPRPPTGERRPQIVL